MRFLRPGRAQPLVHAEQLIVVEGVGTEELKRGPGHYRGTALPGQPGNFAVAGHRTTYGAPVTLTTCFPRFSDRQRLVVFAELVEPPPPSASADLGTTATQ